MSKDLKILIADDEPALRELLTEILRLEYSEIDTANDGKVAIEMLKKTRYDLVLTDIMMPKVGGIEVLKYAKEKYNDIIVMIMTGQATIKVAIDSLNLGADEFITKPIEVQQILNAIRSNVRKQHLTRENIRLQEKIRKDRDSLRKNLAETSILYDLSKNLTHNFDISEVFDSILKSLSEAVEHDFCSIFNTRKNEITIHTDIKLSSKTRKWIESNLKDLAKKESVDIDRHNKTKIIVHEIKNAKNVDGEVLSFSNTFLKGNDQIVGIMHVGRLSGKEFTEDDRAFLKKISEQSNLVFERLQTIIESQKDKMQTLIEGLPDGVILHDQRDDSILINPAARAMFPDPGVDCTKDIVENTFDLAFDELYLLADKSGESMRREYEIKSQGSSMVLGANITTIAGRDGLPQGVILVLRDITEERELDRLKSKFIANVSHELRTPASIVKEFIAVLHDRIPGPLNDRQAEYLGVMTNNIERLLRLVNNLLSISRIEAGTIALKKNTVDLKRIFNNVYNTMNVSLNKKKQTLKMDVQEDLPNAYVDPDALTQILVNCIENAGKFSDESQEITFGAEIKDDNLYMYVKDSGKGLPESEKNMIFQRFYQVNKHDVKRPPGSGLGLAIVKEFVDLHNGRIELESELGKGTTVHFYIPYIKNEKAEVTGG